MDFIINEIQNNNGKNNKRAFYVFGKLTLYENK